jgi:glycolate oxidase FAD binding subunit
VLWGGGTRIGVGAPPQRYDTAIDLRGLSGVVDHSPPDLVCTVRAGTTLAALDARLSASGQRWPVEVADAERATVGGTIASAAPSPSRLRWQHPRDWVIGCTAVLGDGTIARAGGRVVKNVTGYDLTRLYSGTFGTLAAIADVSLKLVAVDESVRTFRIEGSGAIDDLRRLPLDSLVLVSGRESALYVRVAGLFAAADRLAREIAKHGASELDPVTWARSVFPSADASFVARASVPPWREREITSGDAIAYVGTGSSFFVGERSDAEIRDLRERCERMGGALVLERADASRKRALGVWGTPRKTARIDLALKTRFDPKGVLAPGRLPA